jgi:hypothetical protein
LSSLWYRNGQGQPGSLLVLVLIINAKAINLT